MARNGRPADHSCRGCRDIKTQGRRPLFGFHTLQTRAYDFPPIQKDFLDLLSRNAPPIFLGPKVDSRPRPLLVAGRYGKSYPPLFAYSVDFIYKILCAPTKTKGDVTPTFMVLSRIL